MPFPNYPYTDFHRLNADWILKTVRKCAQKVKEAAETLETYADRLLQVETDVTLLETSVNNMRNTLTATTEKANGAVRFDVSQFLNSTQQAQARTNIGAVSASDIPQGVVRYDESQSLSDTQKNTARTNIGAAASADIPDVSDVVRTTAQTLTDAQKTQARQNIGASQAGTVPAGTVRYDAAQTLTDLQKAQARTNIGAAAIGDTAVPFIVSVGPDELGTSYVCNKTRTEIVDAWQANRIVEVVFAPINSPDTNITIPITVTTDGDVVAIAFMPEPPTVSINTTWHRLFWTLSNNQESFTVVDNEGRFVPTSTMSDTGKVLTVAANGRPAWHQILPTKVTDYASTSISLASATDNTIYAYGELTSLTVTAIPAVGDFIISFNSGNTPTVTSFPASMNFQQTFAAEANTHYEISVSNGYAVVGAWHTT